MAVTLFAFLERCLVCSSNRNAALKKTCELNGTCTGACVLFGHGNGLKVGSVNFDPVPPKQTVSTEGKIKIMTQILIFSISVDSVFEEKSCRRLENKNRCRKSWLNDGGGRWIG